ncbi:transcription factor GTE1-like, partial [Trifolium medium]|nr:transcription factor GTE1-like [Trifolium medium]
MPKGNSTTKDKDKEKHVPSIKKQQQDASRREAAAQKRMQDLIRQFGTILRQ